MNREDYKAAALKVRDWLKNNPFICGVLVGFTTAHIVTWLL
jgi:hypothetical protein